jgi:hypothetical protein
MSAPIVWSEGLIARAISQQTLAKKCVVLVDNCNWTGYECDVLGVTVDLRIIDIEVKISRSDLKADAKKDKWWHRQYGAWVPGQRHQETISTAREHPRKVWKHYYALPQEIWKPELIDCLPSKASGVLLLKHYTDLGKDFVWVTCERRATPNKDAYRLKPNEVMDIARLANLRMWESYKREADAKAEANDFYHGRRQVLTPYQGAA